MNRSLRSFFHKIPHPEILKYVRAVLNYCGESKLCMIQHKNADMVLSSFYSYLIEFMKDIWLEHSHLCFLMPFGVAISFYEATVEHVCVFRHEGCATTVLVTSAGMGEMLLQVLVGSVRKLCFCCM